jgi:hypothetical protein
MRRVSCGIVAIWLAVASLSAAQVAADKVPTVVKQAYQAKFPGQRTVEWKLKTDGNYEAEFKWHGVDVAVKFSAGGKWLETETTIPVAQLTKEVSAAIARDFKGYKIIETQRLDDMDKRVLLEVHLENAKEVVKTQFEPGGKLVSRSAKPKTKADLEDP